MSYVLIQLINKCLSAAIVVFLAAGVDAEAVGAYFRVLLIAGALQVFIDFGRARAMQRVLSEGVAAAALARGNSRFVAACTAGAVFGLLGFAATTAYGLDPGLPVTVGLAGLLSLTALFEATLLGLGHRLLAGLTSGLSPVLLLSILTACVVARQELTFATLLGAQITASLFASLFSHKVVRKVLQQERTSSACDVRLHMRSTGVLNALAFIYHRSDLLLIAAFLPPPQLAAYTVAYRVVEIGTSALQLLHVARLRSHVQAQGDLDDQHFKVTVAVLVTIATVVAAGLSTAGFVGQRFTDESGTALAEALALLTLLAPLLIPVALSQAAAVAIYAGLGDRANSGLLRVSAASVAVAVAANATVLYTLDVTGVAAAQPVIEGLCALLNLVAVKRILKLGPGVVLVAGGLVVLVVSTSLSQLGYAQVAWLWVAALVFLLALPRLTSTSRREVLARW